MQFGTPYGYRLSHNEEGTQAEGVREYGAEDIWERRRLHNEQLYSSSNIILERTAFSK